MRIPGLGGKALARLGATVILCPGSEVFTNLERGVIDATEWIGPVHDEALGLYKVAKYYYYPGWHEPGACVELLFNKQAYEELPVEYQAILDAACAEVGAWTTHGFDVGNGYALQRLLVDHKVNLLPFSDEILAELKTSSKEVIADIAAQDPMAKKVYQSFEKFKKVLGPWLEISAKPYYDNLLDRYSLKG
jgi:TRAP-type mannitol/chloroaromatic compound transport system substrate-binding protein